MSEKKLNEQQTTPLANNAETFIPDTAADTQKPSNSQQAEPPKSSVKQRKKPISYFGLICIGVFLMSFFMVSPAVDTSEAAQRALNNGYSTELAIGTRLLSNDETMTARDIGITHSYHNENTSIWIWDFAAEDGDYVQIIVNGIPLGDAFMIRHRPVQLTVPSVGEIQVLGIRDGVGGITYAIHFGLNGTTYFNAAPVGDHNTFTLIRQ